MVKKRAKLAGQATEMMFSEEGQAEERDKKKSATEKKGASPKKKQPAKPTVVPQDFIKKVSALKDLIKEFKKLVDGEEFKKMKVGDLGKY